MDNNDNNDDINLPQDEDAHTANPAGLSFSTPSHPPGPSQSLPEQELEVQINEQEKKLYQPSKLLREHPATRMAYLETVTSCIARKQSQAEATRQLRGMLRTNRVAGVDQVNPKPATTFKAARNRLGVDPDPYITVHPCCDVCFKCYTQEEIDALPTANCKVPCCRGQVYTVKRGTDGKEYRYPKKRIAHCSLIKSLHRMFLRPDFVANLCDPELDQQAEAELEGRGDHYVMTDVHDAAAWLRGEIRLQRVVGEDGKVRDVEVMPGSRKKIIAVLYGLRFTINLDWYGIFALPITL